jgi:transcriptional regulator with XRE-family HTH domain
VVAENLAYYMGKAELTQTALAAKAGVSQKTVSNYLNPEQRADGAKGKEPSAKVSELDLIARALGIEAWQLMRAMTERERLLYERIEKAYADLVAPAEPVEKIPNLGDGATVKNQRQEAEDEALFISGPRRKPKERKRA